MSVKGREVTPERCVFAAGWLFSVWACWRAVLFWQAEA